jgi:hypothetical protein
MPDTTQYVHYDVFDATASRKAQGPKRGPVARPTNRVDSLIVIKHLRTISAVAHICGRCVSDEARESRNDYPASVCRVIRSILHVSFKTDTQKLWIYSRCTARYATYPYNYSTYTSIVVSGVSFVTPPSAEGVQETQSILATPLIG